MSSVPERAARDEEVPSAPPDLTRDPPDGTLPEIAPAFRCARCQKRIEDLEMEVYFGQSGLCFWCAYVDPQG